MILIGAQQTASEVERRVVANSAVRVVGRLDAAEAGREQYGFLPAVQRQRATILKPGSMFVSQPRLPCPCCSSSRSRPGRRAAPRRPRPPAPSGIRSTASPDSHGRHAIARRRGISVCHRGLSWCGATPSGRWADMALEELLDDGVELLDHRQVDLAAAREATYVFSNEVTYEYPAPIRSLHHQFVVVPRRRHGDQRRIVHRIHADVPDEAAVRRRYDRFGNLVVDVHAPGSPERFSFGVRAVLHRARRRRPRPSVARRARPARRCSPRPTRRCRSAAAAGRHRRRPGQGASASWCASTMTYELGPTSVRTTRRRGVGTAARGVPGHGPRDDRDVPLAGHRRPLRVGSPARRGRQPRLGRGPRPAHRTHRRLRPDACPPGRPALRHRGRRPRLPRRRADRRVVPRRPAWHAVGAQAGRHHAVA